MCKIKEWRWSSIGFIIIIAIIVVSHFVFCHSRINKLEETHKEIAQLQKEHITKLASSFCLFDEKCSDRIEHSINRLLPNLNTEDSILYKKTQFERDSITKLLLIELLQKNNYAEVFTHAPILHNEVSEASNNIESLIKLHLDRVEHEYTNITIWAAVLTILFLVFSFYSLFRLEELKKEAKENMSEIKKEGDRLMNKMENDDVEHQERVSRTIEGFGTIENGITERMNEVVNKSQEELDAIKKEYKDKLDILLKNYTDFLTTLQSNSSQPSEKKEEEGRI